MQGSWPNIGLERWLRRTGSAAGVVEGKLGNTGIELEKERQRLANATGSAEDGNLGELYPVISLVSTEFK